MSTPARPTRSRGAGIGGGLLFLLLAGFVAFIVVQAVVGFLLKFVLAAAFVLLIVAIAVNVLRRR
jgi:predicted lipid-binding transport protein (Tim44 family)